MHAAEWPQEGAQRGTCPFTGVAKDLTHAMRLREARLLLDRRASERAEREQRGDQHEHRPQEEWRAGNPHCLRRCGEVAEQRRGDYRANDRGHTEQAG